MPSSPGPKRSRRVPREVIRQYVRQRRYAVLRDHGIYTLVIYDTPHSIPEEDDEKRTEQAL
jgi:hypothetical protein